MPIVETPAMEVPVPVERLGDVAQLPSLSTVARIHYLDNLRALAMMLGVLLHSGLAYANPAQTIWLATDRTSSVVIDVVIWFIHLFRMALFFLISGYFAKFLIERKGVKGFLWNRTVRLVFPFLLFYPLLVAAMTACIIFGLSYVKEPTGLMGMIAAASKSAAEEGAAGPAPPPPSTMHLWFVYYLVMFSLIAAAMSRMKWLRGIPITNRPWLMVLAPLALVPGAMAAGVPMGAPESFIPHWWPFAFYGLFYWSGWQLFRHEARIDALHRYWIPLSIASVVLFIPYYSIMPILNFPNVTQLDTSRRIIEAVIGSYLSVILVILSLLAGRKILDWHSPYLRLVSDASYWIYLVHLPIATLIQTLLIEAPMNVWAKLCLTTLGTLLVCSVSYLIFVRYTPIGWLLNGKRVSFWRRVTP